ncbi:ATP-binding protein [Breznakiella homolactica]|uniref:tRNA 2-thiocytidine biosynthesis protein TtcA n=1 Tax=Breznakiella homolactica TaxID=2798577 RepID=A0A7T7XL96_9SPIR|nr:tRNA 2-thiocytidine biosynthesis TtcA family protein [Breznakiella homolactica]QQO08352.1 tRNA 2-thiocytidine biosynthesis TtcA family protein [Breznakiella homolactica]
MNIERSFTKALHDFSMAEAGDRILIGASGGKDSLALSFLFSRYAGRRGRDISLFALKVRNREIEGAPDPGREARLKKLYESWGIPLEFTDAPAPAESRPEKNGCFRCASLRRKAVMDFAVRNSMNKIAFGHHLDDILTTFLMNMAGRGNGSAMKAVRKYDGFGVALIRPLVYVPEESIRRFAAVREWSAAACTCPQGTGGLRSLYRERLETLCGSSLEAKRRMLAVLISEGKV